MGFVYYNADTVNPSMHFRVLYTAPKSKNWIWRKDEKSKIHSSSSLCIEGVIGGMRTIFPKL